MKELDFNSVDRPTLKLTMPDDAHTVIMCCTPTEKLIERLIAATTDLQTALDTKDPHIIDQIYQLAADLMSCNRNFKPVTVQDLKEVYRLDFEGLIIFFSAYTDFIQEIQTVKN